MRKMIRACSLIIALCCSAMLHAQESLVGTYSGNYMPATGGVGSTQARGVQLTISSEENGVVKGTARLTINVTRGMHPCSGEYPMEGKLTDGKLVMRGSKTGGTGDCSFSFNAVKEGNKLVGTTGTGGTGSPLQLTK